MEMGSPVIVISAYGRGHWLAAALAQEGVSTTLVEVSGKLGVWPSEDVEGPFGFFRTDRITETQFERLNSDDPYTEVPEGFTLWLSDGPVECKGPLTKFKLENLRLASPVQDFLVSNQHSSTQKSLYRNAEAFSFEQSWLWHFAHQWASTTYVPNARSVDLGSSLPLFSSFLVRGSTRLGLEKSLDWLISKGVQVIRPQQIVDASFGPHRTITGLELSGEKQGVLSGEQFVWTLSSEETYFMNERLGKHIFPQQALESEWCWVRYRISLQACSERDSLPLHAVLMEDLDSPWTHENMMVLQRTSVADQFDMWMRVPTVQRFNKEYLTVRSDRMKQELIRRMSLSDPQILNFPQEYYYTYAQLGAPRHPVFSESHKGQRGRQQYRNMRLGGPEVWTQYSWESYFETDSSIRSELLQWWKEKQLKLQKEKRKEESL